MKPDPCPYCKLCKNCPGFQKVLAAPDAGYVLYRHTTRVEDINKKTGAVEIISDTVDDVFIIENTQGAPLGKIEFAPDIDLDRIGCPRCARILQRAQKLLQNQDFAKSNVIGVCEHCRQKTQFGTTCLKCKEVVEKFQLNRRAQKQDNTKRVKTWLSKIQELIKVSLFDDKGGTKKDNQLVRRYSDVDIKNMLMKVTKTDREPAIEDLFLHDIRDLCSAKKGPLSERSRYPEGIKDKEPIFYEPSQHDKTTEQQKVDLFPVRKRRETETLMLSDLTLTEDEIEKEFILRYGKSYKDHRKDKLDDEMIPRYAKDKSKNIFLTNDKRVGDTDFIPVPRTHHGDEKKKEVIHPAMKDHHDDITIQEIPKISKYYEKQKDGDLITLPKACQIGDIPKEVLQSVSKTFTPEKARHDGTYTVSSPIGKRYEDERTRDTSPGATRFDSERTENISSEPDREQNYKIRKDYATRDNARKRGIVPETIVAADKDYKEDKTMNLPLSSPTQKELEKRKETKISPDTKILYESPSRMRKYHSEESLLTGMTKIKGDLQKEQTFEYYFPDTIEARKKEPKSKVVGSAELIKDTLDKLKAKIEEERKKREEAERLKEERRKRLEREKKAREELLAKKIIKDLGTRSKYEEKDQDLDSNIHYVSKDDLENERVKGKAAKGKVSKEKAKKEKDLSEDKKKGKPIDKEEKSYNKEKEEKIKERKTSKDGKVAAEKVIDQKPPKEIKIVDDSSDREKQRKQDADDLKKKLAEEKAERETQMNELKKQREELKKQKLEAQAQKAKEAAERKNAQQQEKPEQHFELTKIKIKKPSIYDLIQRRNRIKERSAPKIIIPTPIEIKKHYKHSYDTECQICNDSDIEMEIENMLWAKQAAEGKEKFKKAIIGPNIYNFKTQIGDNELVDEHQPIVFQKSFGDNFERDPGDAEKAGDSKLRQIKSGKSELEHCKGVIRYSLSDRSFIEKGWTMLPTEKVVRKMNVYRMRPAHPEFDWFERNRKKGTLEYESGEKLADFNENGRGRLFYRSGMLALDYYNAEEVNAQQRFVVYSSGEPDQRGRSRPRTVLASFDYLGNGIVFDHSGKIRLKYNQTEGVVLDRTLGPVSHWKWHTLNDPPVLQQVMIDTQMSHKDQSILKLGGPGENKPRPDDEEMLAIEFDNFIKDKSAKLSQSFKPFQIRMKALKINEYFSLRVLDQANVHLLYRDGSTNVKLNIGMLLDHKEIVDTDTAEVGEVLNNLERLPAKTDSLAELQRNIANAQMLDRVRTERDKRIRRPQPVASSDKLMSGASKPMKLPLLTVDSTASVGVSRFCRCKKSPTCNVYYDTSLV